MRPLVHGTRNGFAFTSSTDTYCSMLDTFKRWFHGSALSPEGRPLAVWAKQHGHTFKTVKDRTGFVLDCADEAEHRTWRIEWGPAQRAYITGLELRFREELVIHSDVQLMLVSRQLANRLETDVFDSYTEAMQTQIDTSLPEESRWLAMFPKVSLSAHKALRPHFQLLGATQELAEKWLDDEFAQALEAATQSFLMAAPEFVLMVMRGRLYLRLAASRVDGELLDQVCALFRVASARARAVALLLGEPPAPRPSAEGSFGDSGEWPTTTASAWQISTQASRSHKP